VAVSTGASETLIREILALKKGGPLDADDIEAAQARLRTRLPELGYPFALVDQPDIVIDRATRTGTYRLAIAPGSQAVVRQVRIEGARRFGDEQIARIARIAPGDQYDARDVEDLRRALVATGLFGGVNVRAVPADRRADGMQQVDIVATTEAAPLRTLAGQAGYSTGEGIRVEASWQHRNLVQPQGAVTVRGVAGTREQRLAGELRFNNFRDRDRSLSLLAEASNENQDAYEAESLTLAARLERETNLIWQKTWFWSVGSELVATSERDTDLASGITRDRTFAIAAFPASLSYDGTESLLDPTDGFRLSGRLSPELSLQNGAFAYLRAQVDGSVYQPITETIVAAARGRLGSIFGAERDRIAPSRRFYAGGGGSVRGFGYQDIGPRDQFGDPIGGRSLAEMAAELRFRVFGEFGLVAFVDAGQLYTSSMPRFSDFRFGAGFGVRYYSSFGPIRVDVATPLEPRPGDNDVGVYVSIGQAF
jgi:translocation and assembly module TamA